MISLISFSASSAAENSSTMAKKKFKVQNVNFQNKFSLEIL